MKSMGTKQENLITIQLGTERVKVDTAGSDFAYNNWQHFRILPNLGKHLES